MLNISPWLTMGGSDDVFIADEHTSALVFGEKSEPR
jgi:hypothetical protein